MSYSVFKKKKSSWRTSLVISMNKEATSKCHRETMKHKKVKIGKKKNTLGRKKDQARRFIMANLYITDRKSIKMDEDTELTVGASSIQANHMVQGYSMEKPAV